MAIKSVWVEAPFKEFGKWHKQSVQVGTEKRTSKKLLSQKEVEKEVPVYGLKETWHVHGHSDSEIDGEKFSRLIEEAASKLEEDGFTIINITPVISGQYDSHTILGSSGGGGYGYGYSYTSGVTILAKR